MKYFILISSLLLSGCQAYIFDDLPAPPASSHQGQINLTIGVNESHTLIEGFSLINRLKQSNTFKSVEDSNDKNSEYDLFLVTKMESGPNGSVGAEFISAMLTALTAFVIPAGRGQGYILSYYLFNSSGDIVAHYVHQKNVTVLQGVLMLPIDGLADAKPERFRAAFAEEATEHFIHFLKEDRTWIAQVTENKNQRVEYDQIFAELGLE